MTADTAATATLSPGPAPGPGPGATADDMTISWADFRTWEDQLADAGIGRPVAADAELALAAAARAREHHH